MSNIEAPKKKQKVLDTKNQENIDPKTFDVKQGMLIRLNNENKFL